MTEANVLLFKEQSENGDYCLKRSGPNFRMYKILQFALDVE